VGKRRKKEEGKERKKKEGNKNIDGIEKRIQHLIKKMKMEIYLMKLN
jgi:hypothetical protein